MTKTHKKNQIPLSRALTGLLLLTGYLCFFSGRWFVGTYGRTGFDSILFTMSSALGGVQSGLVQQFLLEAVLPCLAFTAVTCLLLFRSPKPGKFQSPSRKVNPVLIGILIACVLIGFAAFDVELVDYVADQFSNSGLYEKHFVDPNSVSITFPDQKRNLVYIMLESMEISYLSQELGGAKQENINPTNYYRSCMTWHMKICAFPKQIPKSAASTPPRAQPGPSAPWWPRLPASP